MHIINITVRNKIAVNPAQDRYVCGNSDYIVRFDFDAEWDGFENKTARFVKEDGSYVDQLFSGSECPVPVISDTYKLQVGVYAGDLSTTTAAYVPCKKSILCGGGVPADPAPDVYGQIMKRLNAFAPEATEPHTELVTGRDGEMLWKPRDYFAEDAFSMTYGVEVDADALSVQAYKADGTESPVRWVKVSDFAPDVERAIAVGTIQTSKSGSKTKVTEANIFGSTEDGYVIGVRRDVTNTAGEPRTINYTYVAVCFKAGYKAEGTPQNEYVTGMSTATLPEPGLYLPVASDGMVRYGFILDEYVKPLDDKYIPNTIARKSDIPEIPEPVSDEHINALIDVKLSGFGSAYILPETTLLGVDDSGDGKNDLYYITSAWAKAPTLGSVYTVVYNGAKYECEAIEMPENPDFPAGAFLMGNVANFGIEGITGNPDAPFAMMGLPEPSDGIVGMVIPADGAESVTLAINSRSAGYYYFDGSTAQLVTIDQLKADLGLT